MWYFLSPHLPPLAMTTEAQGFLLPRHPDPKGISLGARKTAGVDSLKANPQAGTQDRRHRECLPLQMEASMGASQDPTQQEGW